MDSKRIDLGDGSFLELKYWTEGGLVNGAELNGRIGDLFVGCPIYPDNPRSQKAVTKLFELADLTAQVKELVKGSRVLPTYAAPDKGGK